MDYIKIKYRLYNIESEYNWFLENAYKHEIEYFKKSKCFKILSCISLCLGVGLSVLGCFLELVIFLFLAFIAFFCAWNFYRRNASAKDKMICTLYDKIKLDEILYREDNSFLKIKGDCPYKKEEFQKRFDVCKSDDIRVLLHKILTDNTYRLLDISISGIRKCDCRLNIYYSVNEQVKTLSKTIEIIVRSDLNKNVLGLFEYNYNCKFYIPYTSNKDNLYDEKTELFADTYDLKKDIQKRRENCEHNITN